MERVKIESVEVMQSFAAGFIAEKAKEPHATVLALSGQLGAGKTTFTQALAHELGVEETVNSPTFVIQKVYALQGQSWQRLVHIDAYRLKSAGELQHLGWDELVADSGNLVVVEWPEKIEGAIPVYAHRIAISIEEDEARTLWYE